MPAENAEKSRRFLRENRKSRQPLETKVESGIWDRKRERWKLDT